MNHAITLHTAKTRKGRRKFSECTCGWVSPHTPTTDAALKVIIKQHPQAICPTPDKRRFPTEREAEVTMLKMRVTAPLGKKVPCRVYKCLCGWWHTTSKGEKNGHQQEDS